MSVGGGRPGEALGTGPDCSGLGEPILGPGGLGRAGWRLAELLAATLKGILGLWSLHFHCPQVSGVTGQ